MHSIGQSRSQRIATVLLSTVIILILLSSAFLEKEMATHSSVLAWRIPRTKEPGGLQSVGSQRVRHD